MLFLVKKGEKVGNSEATLLAKLNIRPFSYGLRLINVYDNGSVYAPAVLDLTDNDILARFKQGVQNIAAVGLQIGYSTIATVPHSLINGYKNLLAVAFETQYSFKRAEAIKAFIANPTAAAAQAAPAHAAKTETKDVKKKEEKKKEEVKEEPEDEDIGIGGLF